MAGLYRQCIGRLVSCTPGFAGQSTSEIAPEAHIKRTKYVDARKYLDTEADIDSEDEGIEDEDDKGIEDEDEGGSFINDQASEDSHTPALSDPLQDEAAWDILEEYLTSDMNFPQMEVKLVSHLGSRYCEEDWMEATHALFSANEDNTQALTNLRTVKARHFLPPAKVAGPSRGSFHQSACAWFNKVADLESRFAPNSGLSRVNPPSQLVPSSSEVTCRTIKCFIQDEIGSSHAYYLLEVEFSDNPMSMAHWESILDAIVDAVTCEARLQIFDTRTSDVVEHAISSTTSPAVSDQFPRGIGVFEELASSTQDDGMASARSLPTWLVTVPFSKTSFLAAQLKSKGFEVYTHSTLPGHLCVKAEDTLVIKKAWPSTHANCFFDVLFVPREDQVTSKPSLTIPGWYRPMCGQYRHDVGYTYSYDLQTNTITLLVASREVPGREVRKDHHMPRLYNPPNGDSSSAVVEIPIPAPESIILHQELRCNPAFVQSTLHVYAAQHWIEGDLVRVRAGEMFGCTAKIQCVEICTQLASAHMEELVHMEKISHEPIMFSISDLERKFHMGDSVRVLDSSLVTSQLKGKTGMVVQVNDNTVDVLDQSSKFEFTVAINSLATFVGGDVSKQEAPTNVSTDTPMKGDYFVVTEGFYIGEFGVVSKVDMRSRTLAFFSASIHQYIWVPIRMTAFNPNPTALQYTRERGYDIVASDIVQVVRGDSLHTQLKEFTTSITHVARIHGRADRDPMWHLLGKEVFIIQGPMKSYQGTLHSLSQHTCEVAVQGRKQEIPRAHVISWKGVLLTGVYLPPRQLREFLRLARGSFIQPPHITPPRTPCHLPPPDVSHADQTAPAVQVSVWDAPVDSLVIDQRPSPAAPHDDPWTLNEADREEHQLHPPSASTSSSPANPSSDWASYHNWIVDTVALDPFLLEKGPVKDGEILISTAAVQVISCSTISYHNFGQLVHPPNTSSVNWLIRRTQAPLSIQYQCFSI
ncbi:uncharacterized protein EDB91DRAFT_1081055 [Suillus paluster]|uniref:uncharacterized protein n=1 Tax=Suillus paluster TaxID=48578 RepID=UPI001B86AE96|nr:uncharacterized protein EDB91DRAFT_1081055 [Suillus paluster]KAG1743673.1 hypothetical protein EDB91DRAFT_1081055 [Suillus paluster]